MYEIIRQILRNLFNYKFGAVTAMTEYDKNNIFPANSKSWQEI